MQAVYIKSCTTSIISIHYSQYPHRQRCTHQPNLSRKTYPHITLPPTLRKMISKLEYDHDLSRFITALSQQPKYSAYPTAHPASSPNRNAVSNIPTIINNSREEPTHVTSNLSHIPSITMKINIDKQYKRAYPKEEKFNGRYDNNWMLH